MTTDLWTYRQDLATAEQRLDGFDVDAADGHIGTIDEATYEVGESAIVVDTGFWIFGKKRVIPARAIKQVNTEDRKVFVSMTKDEVKGAPDYHNEWAAPDHREQFDQYYHPFRW